MCPTGLSRTHPTQDIWEADVTPATVVTLYLRQDVNLKLRPKLLRELRPGTRVVSHDFDMGDWRPERMVRVQGPTREHVIYLWVVPRLLGVRPGEARERNAV